MKRENAETIALQALAWLVADGDEMDAFMGHTGLDQAALRAGAGDSAFLGGVLDYLLAEEARLMAFVGDAGLKPDQPARARAALPGANPDW